MNSQKIPFNYIENKIRSFKNDVDYTFTGEEYHAPSGNKDYNVNGYTQRTYQILSPQLQKTVQNYLTQQVAIFMQFEFEGRAYTMEWFRPDRVGKNWEEKYYACTNDENGKGLIYDYRGNVTGERGYLLTITYPDKPRISAEEFNRRYQVAKKRGRKKVLRSKILRRQEVDAEIVMKYFRTRRLQPVATKLTILVYEIATREN